MSKKVKGMSIILGADASPAAAALGDIEKAGRSTAKELGEVQRQLKFEPGNTELLAQKQELLTQQVANTADKLKILREAQEDVNKRFKEGDISSAQHREFQRELVKSESMLESYEKQLSKVNFENTAFKQSLDKIAGALDSAGKKMTSIGGTLTKSVTAPVLGATAALTALVVKSAETSDRVDKLSQQVGLSRKAFQEWDYVLDQTGGNIDSLKTGMSSLAGAAESDKEAFRTLGVEVEDASGKLKSQEDLLYEVVNALQAEEDITRRNALGKQLLGRSATELSVLLNSEAGELEALTKRAHELGLVLDDDVIDKSAKTSDMISDLKRSFSAATTQLASELMPAFIAFSELILDRVMPAIRTAGTKLGELVSWFNSLNPALQNTIGVLGVFLVAIGPVITVIGTLTSSVGAVIGALGTLAAFIKTTLIPAIMGINWPVVLTVAGIAALAAIAFEVYRAWDEVKVALAATWEYLRAQAENMGLKIAIAMQKMKLAIIDAVDTMLDKLSVLEKLPWGLGEQFQGLKDKVSDSIDGTVAKISELESASEANKERIGEALDEMKVSFSDLGSKVSEDIELVKDKLRSLVYSNEESAEEIEEQVQKIGKAYQAQGEMAQEQTEVIKEEAEEQNTAREDFEREWNEKLFGLQATRLEKIEAEYEEALALAEQHGADKLAIEEYFQILRERLREEEEKADAEAQAKILKAHEEFNEKWNKLIFEETASPVDILQRQKQVEIKAAIDAGEDWLKVDQYYNLLIEKEWERHFAKLEEERQKAEAAEAKALAERLDAQKKAQEQTAAFNEAWNKKYFELTQDKIDILQREKQIEIDKAIKAGQDWLKVDQYYNELIRQERQKHTDEMLAEAKRLADEEQAILDKQEEERLRIEERWAKKLFEQTADRIEILEAERDEEVKIAKEKGANTLAISEFYNTEITRERQKQADERVRIAEEEAERLAAIELKKDQDRLAFEEEWTNKLTSLKAEGDLSAQLAILEAEASKLEELAVEMEASGESIAAIQEYYAIKRGEIELQIAEEGKTRWEIIVDSLESPLESLIDAVSNAAGKLKGVASSILSGNWKDAFLTILMETESFGKAMELLGKVLKPVITLFDNVLRPVIELITGIWNAIMKGLSTISIFGWRPFGGLENEVIDTNIGKAKADERNKNETRKGGRQVSEITGPTRDLFSDLLKPLTNLNQIVSPMQDIKNLLAEHLPRLGSNDMAFAGMGGGVVIQNLNVTSATNSIQDISDATIDEIERALADRYAKAKRGRGNR